jgi:hypothetical protein
MRLCVNVSILFKEVPFLGRFARAAEAGFSAAKFCWPSGEDLDEVEGAAPPKRRQSHRLRRSRSAVLGRRRPQRAGGADRARSCTPDGNFQSGRVGRHGYRRRSSCEVVRRSRRGARANTKIWLRCMVTRFPAAVMRNTPATLTRYIDSLPTPESRCGTKLTYVLLRPWERPPDGGA